MGRVFFTGERHANEFRKLMEKYPRSIESNEFVAAAYICSAIYAAGYITQEGIDLERAIEKGRFPRAHLFLLKTAKSFLEEGLSDIYMLDIEDTLVLTEAVKIASLGLNYQKSLEIKARVDAFFERMK